MSRKREIKLGLQEILKVNCDMKSKVDLVDTLFTRYKCSTVEILKAFAALLDSNPYDGEILQREFSALLGTKWKLMMQEISSESDAMETMDTVVPNVKVSNRFEALTDPDIEKDIKKDETSNVGVLKPPPIIVREKNNWPKISETLKNFGIQSVKNYDTRDGIRMILPSMEMYTKSMDILDQEKVQYHTFPSPPEREIRAIFKGVAEDIDINTITKDFHNKGFTPRIVARFKNRKGKNMPIVLVIVPGTQASIKNISQICDIEAEPVCRHCAGKHESRAHDKDDVGPNKCNNCEGPHKSNFRGCPAFPPMEKKDEKKEPPPPPRRARTPRNLGNNNIPRTSENSTLNELLTAMDELKELLIRRPILAGLIQLKHSQGAIALPSTD
ncbi:hypothetical protein JTB14_037461 [Gonioctena quinquepunctata]|nr:hypothetical protein JTB14_037461 [Gonioctena quinquepunctata]